MELTTISVIRCCRRYDIVLTIWHTVEYEKAWRKLTAMFWFLWLIYSMAICLKAEKSAGSTKICLSCQGQIAGTLCKKISNELSNSFRWLRTRGFGADMLIFLCFTRFEIFIVWLWSILGIGNTVNTGTFDWGGGGAIKKLFVCFWL